MQKMKPRKFGAIRAADCRMLGVRLPADVIARLNEASGGVGARELLTQLALTIAGGSSKNEYSNQA